MVCKLASCWEKWHWTHWKILEDPYQSNSPQNPSTNTHSCCQFRKLRIDTSSKVVSRTVASGCHWHKVLRICLMLPKHEAWWKASRTAFPWSGSVRARGFKLNESPYSHVNEQGVHDWDWVDVGALAQDKSHRIKACSIVLKQNLYLL